MHLDFLVRLNYKIWKYASTVSSLTAILYTVDLGLHKWCSNEVYFQFTLKIKNLKTSIWLHTLLLEHPLRLFWFQDEVHMSSRSFLFKCSRKQKKKLKIFAEVTHIMCVESWENFKHSHRRMTMNSVCQHGDCHQDWEMERRFIKHTTGYLSEDIYRED